MHEKIYPKKKCSIPIILISFCLDEQQNPYKPTYTFPEEFDGDLIRMEDYIRKAASENIDDEDNTMKNIRNVSSSMPIRTHFDDQLSSRITSSPIKQTKSVRKSRGSLAHLFINFIE